MIGQRHLQEQLYKFVFLDQLPKSILITGAAGMGKHLFAKTIAEKYNKELIELIDLTDDMYTSEALRLYLIDFDKLGKEKRIERFQNTLLKFIEEPPRFAWIIMVSSNEDIVIDTIKNRCQIFRFKPYSLQELQEIAHLYNRHYPAEFYRFLYTPQSIIKADVNTLHSIKALAQQMLTSLNRATPANALSIRNKFFDEGSYDLDLFLQIFNEVLLENYLQNPLPQYIIILNKTNEFQKNLQIMGVNKKDLMDNWLLALKEELSK